MTGFWDKGKEVSKCNAASRLGTFPDERDTQAL